MLNTAFLILLVHAGATLALFGLIWFVQLVHYPLFSRAQLEAFRSFQAENERRTLWVAAPLMFLETATALLLVWRRPPGLPLPLVVAGLSLVLVNWLSTLFLQIPQHRILEKGFDFYAHRQLIATNWIRTFTWTLRCGVVLWMLWFSMA